MSKFRGLQLAHLGDQMASVELEREGGLWESVQSPDRNGLEDIHHAPFLPTNATAPQCPLSPFWTSGTQTSSIAPFLSLGVRMRRYITTRSTFLSEESPETRARCQREPGSGIQPLTDEFA